MPTFRPVDRAERVRHETVMDQAFGADAGPPEYESPDDLDDRIGERWGLYEDGELLSACLLYDLDATLADDTRAIGGVGGFATPPEHRSNRYGTQVQRAFLAEFRDRNYPYAILWPMSIPYYRSHGWSLAHLQTEYELTPAAIEGYGGTAAEGTIEQVEPAEYERLAGVYDEFRREYQLALDRTARWWQDRVLEDAWAYTWTPEGGDEPAGYVIGSLPGTHGEMTLEIAELVASEETARHALLSFVYGYHPQVERLRWSCPEETRVLHDATDPKEVSATVEPGAMGRIVDVRAAIEALPADRTPPRPVTIDVEDQLVDANDDVFRIEAGADGPSVSTGVGAGGDATALELDIGLLSRLYVGGVDVETLARRGDLDVDAETRAALATLFPERQVYLPDFF